MNRMFTVSDVLLLDLIIFFVWVLVLFNNHLLLIVYVDGLLIVGYFDFSHLSV